MDWHEKLFAARSRLNISQYEAGKLIGVHRTTYSRWERGLYAPLPIYKNIIEKIFKDETIFEKEKEI